MNLKKMIFGIALIFTSAVVFASGGKPQGAAASGGPVTLKVAGWDMMDSVVYKTLIDAFKKAHPNINVEMVDIPSADYTQKLQVMLNGGSDVDILWIKDGDTTKGHANRGQLADLSAYIQRDGIDLKGFNGLAERFNLGGKMVALPVSTGYYILYYNKDIFDKAGVPYPSNDMTWSQYEQLCAQLTSGSGTDKVYGGFLHTWNACVQNWGVQDGKNTIMATDYSFFKPYYEMALRLQTAGYIWDYGSLRTSGVNYGSAFLQGNVATLPMGTWFYTTIITRINNQEANIRWGIAALPHPEGVPAGWTVGSVTPLAINQASKNKDAAWEFVKFATGEEGAKIHASAGSLPARANTQTLQSIANAPGMPEGALAALTVKNITLDRPMEDQVLQINQMLGEEHSLIMLGEVTVDQGLANMAKRSKEIQGK
ncbi:MAG: sugar ABC transporter substrate-binding protein [Treponema sp.]|jgi:multiple sugar transport system substrate-binding protein|nr:sugar ABC transporter substrate-binding protein [Treponema sp.]